MANKEVIITSIPIVIFTALVVVFWFSLGNDPTELPSQRIGKEVPEFRLSNLHNAEEFFTNQDLPNKPFLLNVWATWCVSCHVEHPYLVRFANQYPIPIIGLNYKDERVDALKYLQKGGDPYLFSIADEQGTMGIDLGVYGAPETFLVDGNGVIHHRYVGVIDNRVWNTIILPKMKELDPNLEQLEAAE